MSWRHAKRSNPNGPSDGWVMSSRSVRGSVGWVDRARLDGSGETVDLDGEAVLDVYASGTTWPADGYYDGPQRLEPDGGEVDDVHVGGTFEGYTQVLAGIDGPPSPVRVFALPDPPRLVVDVSDGTD